MRTYRSAGRKLDVSTLSLKTEASFWSKVKINFINDACWLWQGSLCEGYGRMRAAGERVVLAHRFSYSLFFGQIPADMVVCHKCDNPQCVRPDHLFLGTSAENTRDKVNKGRQAKGKTLAKRLCEQFVREILLSDLSDPQLAKMYSVNGTTIRRIKNRQIWKHVEI